MQKASKDNNYYYNSGLTRFAQENRRSLTTSAACMWKYVLGRKQMMGYQFRRERPILNYIAGFVCLELFLIIEVDGITHLSNEAIEKDRIRDEKLNSVGFHVLRFGSFEVLKQISNVSVVISEWIEENAEVPPIGPRTRKKK